ncbi:MAG TPA: outer membrane beta-barrel protein [Patescibacteria group bacterium]|nr:outer membrane beta-barrel protein [Patescibacteria group bacterium]
MTHNPLLWRLIGLGCAAVAMTGVAQAQEAGGAAPQAPAKWTDTLKLSLQIDAGANFNAGNPSDHQNFGRLLDDKANTGTLNQVLLTAQRPIDSAAAGYDFGFKLQGLYGSDARYFRPPHEFSGTLTNDLYQVDLSEANFLAHTPWLTDGGVDWKVGRFTAPEGAETLDPSNNYFYSHSYIFNFGIPAQGTGLLATWHTTPLVDLYGGVDTGVNTSVDHGLLHAQNGAAPAFTAGLGLNLMGGDLTLVALSHGGAENTNQAVANGLLPAGTDITGSYRYLNDLVTTWKVNKTLTLVNELNWIHDDVLNHGKAANGYGIAQYGVYALTDEVSLVARGEVFRDGSGVFVTQSGNNVDFLRGEEGLPALSPASHGGGDTTYGAVTVGVNYKPTLGIPYLSSLTLRPELRYDTTLNGTRPFDGTRTDKNMFTGAVDAIIAF